MAEIDDATFSMKGRDFNPKKDLDSLQGNFFILFMLEAKIKETSKCWKLTLGTMQQKYKIVAKYKAKVKRQIRG